MLSVTESAATKLSEYFQDKKMSALRIFFNGAGG